MGHTKVVPRERRMAGKRATPHLPATGLSLPDQRVRSLTPGGRWVALKLSEAGQWRLVVRPEQESRAKEVVREVVEASPPE